MNKFKSIINHVKDMLITNKKIAIPAALVIVLAIGGITAYAVSMANQPIQTSANPSTETSVPTEKESETKPEVFTADVAIELNSIDADHVALPAEVEIILDADAELLDDKSKTVKDMKLALDKATDIAELPPGDYKIHLLATPIEIDGSTYKLPKETVKFTIAENTDDIKAVFEDVKDNEGNFTAKQIVKDDYIITYSGTTGDILISIELERIDVGDMTKEQLESVITRIQTESPDGHQYLIKDLTAKSEQAKSEPESASDITQESASTGESEKKTTTDNGNGGNTNSNNNSNNNTDNSSNSNENSNTGSDSGNSNNNNTDSGNNNTTTPTPTQPETPAHSHTWVNHTTQVAREEQYIVREWDEKVQTDSTPIYETAYVCSLCGYTGGAMTVGQHISNDHHDYDGSITANKTQVQTGSTPIYSTEHKVEYGTRTVYDTVVDYQYCSGCGQKK